MAYEAEEGVSQDPKVPEWWNNRYRGEASHANALQSLVTHYAAHYDSEVVTALYHEIRGGIEGQGKVDFFDATLVCSRAKRILNEALRSSGVEPPSLRDL